MAQVTSTLMGALIVIQNTPFQLEHLGQPTGPDSGIGYEGPHRLEAALKGVALARESGVPIGEIVVTKLDQAQDETLTLVHTSQYLADFRAAVKQSLANGGEPVAFGEYTFVYPATELAATTAVGSGLLAIDLVASKRTEKALVAVRSPGHHAEPELAMGFCPLSNAAIAAMYAQKIHGFKKIAVIDIDIHSGNGTELALRNKEGFLFTEVFISGHATNSYPEPDRATPEAADNILKVPRLTGLSGFEWSGIVEQQLISRISSFGPDLLIISAGFDCMKGDPIGGFGVEPSHIHKITTALARLGVPIVSFLEGGYDLENLKQGVAAHCAGLSGRR